MLCNKALQAADKQPISTLSSKAIFIVLLLVL